MYSIFKPYIFSLDPEVAHDLAIKSLKLNVLPSAIFNVANEELLETNLLGRKIPNPIGNLNTGKIQYYTLMHLCQQVCFFIEFSFYWDQKLNHLFIATF